MLTAITVFAIVGGALAFKAQKYSLPKICSGPAQDNCPNFTVRTTTSTTGVQSYFYTTTFANNCAGITECPTQTYLTKE